jgi:ATP-dependent protease ClpP protease subunit
MARRDEDPHDGMPEIAIVGELAERELDICGRLLEVPVGGNCVLYFNSPGGSAYSALSILSLLRLRMVEATGIVTGECSSAAIWIFAACCRRYVTRHSFLLFHEMKWESGEHVELAEAREWARHFDQLQRSMDGVLVELFGQPNSQIEDWLRSGRYVSGQELAAAGLAEMIDLAAPPRLFGPASSGRRTKKS